MGKWFALGVVLILGAMFVLLGLLVLILMVLERSS